MKASTSILMEYMWMLPTEVAVIPGAGHMVPISHPTETAQVIDAWIRRTGQPTAATENPCAG